jgi:hypothetical protein
MADVDKAWAGWINFAGTLLGLVGMLNVTRGVVALISDERVVQFSKNVVIDNVTAWGWTTLLSGVLLIAIGASVFGRRTWARIAAIVLIILHATAQVAWLDAYTTWAVLMFGLDTVLLFALTARWSRDRDDMPAWGDEAAGGTPRSAGRFAEETTLQSRVR